MRKMRSKSNILTKVIWLMIGPKFEHCLKKPKSLPFLPWQRAILATTEPEGSPAHNQIPMGFQWFSTLSELSAAAQHICLKKVHNSNEPSVTCPGPRAGLEEAVQALCFIEHRSPTHVPGDSLALSPLLSLQNQGTRMPIWQEEAGKPTEVVHLIRKALCNFHLCIFLSHKHLGAIFQDIHSILLQNINKNQDQMNSQFKCIFKTGS